MRCTTSRINQFYEASVVLEFTALGSILDVVAPFNVSTIPNWKWLFGKSANKTISNRVANACIRFIFEDMP